MDHIDESTEQIKLIMRESQVSELIKDSEYDYYFGSEKNQTRPHWHEIRNAFIASKIFNTTRELTEDESIEREVWLENYLDNRNGDTSQRGKWAKRFVRIEQNIQGRAPNEKFLNKSIWYSIHDKDLGLVSENDYVDRIKALQKSLEIKNN